MTNTIQQRKLRVTAEHIIWQSGLMVVKRRDKVIKCDKLEVLVNGVDVSDDYRIGVMNIFSLYLNGVFYCQTSTFNEVYNDQLYADVVKILKIRLYHKRKKNPSVDLLN